jgi:MiaB-like tRNA modifying enzyme
MTNIYLENYGCSANQNNGEIMKGLLERQGFIVTSNPKIADMAILNTCIVKGPTEQRMIARIKELAKKFTRLIVAGCMVDVEASKIKIVARKTNPKILLSLVSVHNITKIVQVVKSMMAGKPIELLTKGNEVKLCFPKSRARKTIGITQISEGCDGHCSYCITKLVKGNLFSYPQIKIIENIKHDLQAGCKEIWLTSQDNAIYGLDRKKHELPELLKKITATKSKFFIRIGMMNPSSLLSIADEMIKIYKNDKVFKFLHIPIQSGSDKVLREMNRRYKVKDFINIVKKFRKAFPDITISTDIIVGYPTETVNDFKKTLALVKDIKPDIINISKFWPMTGTKAAKMKQLPPDEVKNRAVILMKIHNDIAIAKNEKLIGNITKAIVDERGFQDTWLARTDNYKLIAFKSKENLLGKIVNVKIIKARGHYLIGELIR